MFDVFPRTARRGFGELLVTWQQRAVLPLHHAAHEQEHRCDGADEAQRENAGAIGGQEQSVGRSNRCQAGAVGVRSLQSTIAERRRRIS